MKYLITGGAGFIGSNFIHYLVEHHPDAEIVNLDKLTYAGNLENLKAYEGDLRYTFIKGDIAEPKVVNEAMNGADVVVNFAAESHVDRSIHEPAAFVRTNVLGTQVLLDAALRHKVKRYHHVSTDEVYGSIALNSDEKWTEQSPYNPRSPYSASKAASDHLVRAYFHTYSLSATITNCANNIGPYMYPEKLFPLAITNLLEGKKIPVYGQGQHVREWLYVEDHCSAIDLILQKGKPGETYFVSPDNEPVSNLEVIKKILKLMNLPEDRIEFVADRPGHDEKYALDNNKIKRELDWKPKYSLDETVRLTVEWYKNNQEWWKKIKDSQEYKNYYQKQYDVLK
ncbi:MAG: dTDP-glucose 4,6-dehydratase [Candidatus Doudnabacteria bacterium]|nr:dTDP-glucose 4,6-dehydratase [Candidatus Doudnabacteria bacterium]